MHHEEEFGPIEYLIVKFPAGAIDTAGFARILELVDARILRLLDLEFIARNAAGRAEIVPIESVAAADATGILAQFIGASSSLIDEEFLEFASTALEPGDLAAVVIYEEIAVLSVMQAWKRGGASILGMEAIQPAELEITLNAIDGAA